MSEAATIPSVEELRTKLSSTQAALAGARALADARARELQVDPTRQLQQARDEATGQCELLELTAEKLKLELAQAQESERAERQAALLASHGPILGEVVRAEERRLSSLAEHEAALAALLELRLRTRKLNGQLLQAGYQGDALQLNLRVDHEYRRRIAKLEEAYNRAMHPLTIFR
jgi:hypothetical protein